MQQWSMSDWLADQAVVCCQETVTFEGSRAVTPFEQEVLLRSIPDFILASHCSDTPPRTPANDSKTFHHGDERFVPHPAKPRVRRLSSFDKPPHYDALSEMIIWNAGEQTGLHTATAVGETTAGGDCLLEQWTGTPWLERLQRPALQRSSNDRHHGLNPSADIR